jgi:hypothetical protein
MVLYKDPWNPERGELGHPAARGRHLRAIPKDVPLRGPGVVLPPRHRLGYAVGVSGWATGINLGNESARHLHPSPEHRHRGLRPRHGPGPRGAHQAQQGAQEAFGVEVRVA